MVCQDGFITSHAIENIELVETEKVKAFVGEYKPQHFLLNKDEPMAVGAYATPVYYMEAKRQQAQAMMDAKDVIRKVGKEFGEMTGRTYGLIEKFMMDDAEEAIVIIGSSAGTAKEAIRELRAQGKKVGLIKIRSFRPFPAEDICEALKTQFGSMTFDGLTGEGMTWDETGAVSKSPKGMVIKNGAYVGM